MRVGSGSVAKAFIAGRKRKIKNDYTDGQVWWYHGHRIAWKDADGIHVTLAGWPTVTTRLRLNNVADLCGKGRPFSQRNWIQYYGYDADHTYAVVRGWPFPEREIGDSEVITI